MQAAGRGGGGAERGPTGFGPMARPRETDGECPASGI
jgi:hypothetical protein